MKVTVAKAMRLGNRRVVAGEEIEVPDRLARLLIRSGRLRSADAGTAAPEESAPTNEEEEPKKKRTYKTRQMKAEDE